MRWRLLPFDSSAPKRTGGTQQSGTPKPLASGSQQFHATPRFSLHSTPRGVASSSTTPAPTSTFVQRQRNSNAHDGIHDIIDSSPPEPPPRPSYGGAARNMHDSIEADSEPPSSNSMLVPSSQHRDAADAVATVVTTTYYEDEFIDGAQYDGPSPKRRRLSVSSDVDMEPVIPASSQGALVEYSQGASEEGSLESSEDAVDEEMVSHDDESSASPPLNRRTNLFAPQQPQQQQQPKFQPVPRFKPPELPEPGHREPLPDAFSPRRKGAKYVPGGLASELRDWLMNIETATGSKLDGDWAARLRVDEVRTASNMMLVTGSQQQGRRDTDNDSGGSSGGSGLFISKEGDVSSRVILAGEGRLQGLARKSEVAVGCVVGVARPVWEVDLGSEGLWAVACDWVVLSAPS
ncbi:formyl transferase [Apiospora phragmitis]|uniref:Formyl transferase n=1 Tax=Apiospora phragmitis TaxID=2905665 RepID=A0ABR1VTY6_9PEZI